MLAHLIGTLVLLCTKATANDGLNPVTLKALANVSPGFALKPWVEKYPGRLFATLKGLRGFAVNKRPAQLLQSCAFEKWDAFSQGCQSATPGWN